MSEKTKENPVHGHGHESKKPGEDKKHTEEKHSGESPSPRKKGAHNPLPGACFAVGCKAHSKRFNFCDEHYEHFKFGLIKKTGELVSDHEKKFEHYKAHLAKNRVPKVA